MTTEEAGTGLVGIFSRQRSVDRHVLDAGMAAMLEMVKVMNQAGVAVALGTDSAHGTGGRAGCEYGARDPAAAGGGTRGARGPAHGLPVARRRRPARPA
ncbi:hypothetical protein ACOZ38_27460 [Sphaerisporangium viridialbum]|uniref:hypothetical protein n=1 Tax=Sphaerisporangium viridialbum TaxID=46189 RepID=UPI003C77D597